MKTTQEWFNEANTLYESGKFDEADKCLDEALTVDKRFMQAYRWKFKLFYSLGKYKDMIHWCDKAIEADPHYFFAYNSKANALRDLGKFSEALENYDKAISIDPKHAFGHNGKANVLMQLGRIEDALECYDRAIEVDPNSDFAYNGKGSMLWGLGRLEEAKGAYDKGIEKHPKSTLSLCNRGKLLSQMGKQQEAIADFKTIKALYQSGYIDVDNNAETQGSINETLNAIIELDKVSTETEVKLKNADQNNPTVQKLKDNIKHLQEDKDKITTSLISNMDTTNTTDYHKLMEELQKLISEFSEMQSKILNDSINAPNIDKEAPETHSRSKQELDAKKNKDCNVF